jgi:hypothetical protein
MKIPGLSFSLKRAIGITAVKQKVLLDMQLQELPLCISLYKKKTGYRITINGTASEMYLGV